MLMMNHHSRGIDILGFDVDVLLRIGGEGWSECSMVMRGCGGVLRLMEGGLMLSVRRDGDGHGSWGGGRRGLVGRCEWELVVSRGTVRGRVGGAGDSGDRLPQQIGVDGLAANLMLLAVGVEIVLALEPPSTEVALELVFRRVSSAVTGKGGAVVEGLSAERSLADEWAFIVTRKGRLTIRSELKQSLFR